MALPAPRLPPLSRVRLMLARPEPPLLSAAVTETDTALPDTVALLAGAVIDTVGGVVSGHALVANEPLACEDLLPAAS